MAFPSGLAPTLHRMPAVPAAAGVLAGAGLAPHLTWAPVPLLAALLAAGIALRRTAGGLAAGLGAGLLAATVGLGLPGDPWSRLDPRRPVEVRGRISTHWQRTEWGWRSTLRVERLAQGRWVAAVGRDLLVELPGPGPPAPVGARLVARGYAGRSPGYANRLPVGPGPWRLRVKSPRLVAVAAPPGPADRLAAALRGRVEAALGRAGGGGPDSAEPPSRGGGEPDATGSPTRAGGDERPPWTPAADPPAGSAGQGLALVRALVLGDPSRLPAPWLRGLRRTGLSHLLAVSGLHVGLVGGLTLLAAAPLGRRGRIAAALVAIVLYLLVAGPRPAILRASLMGLAAGAALFVGRAHSAGNALALAAALLVLARPELVADLGFGLSVAATAGIVWLAPALVRAWMDVPTDGGGDRAGAIRLWLARALAASVAAQLAAAPLAAPAFHLLSPASPLFNLLAVPWTAVALAVSCAWVLVAAAVPAAGSAAVPLLDAVASPFGWPAAGPPGAWGTLPVAASAPGCLAVAAALALLLARPRRLAGLLALAALLAPAAVDGRRGASGAAGGRRVELAMLDVGQGDALLLRDGPLAVLVDGGGWRRGDFGGRVLLPALLGAGVTRLAAAVLTHPDADHCGGLVDLASYLSIDEVWMTADGASTPCGAALAALPGVPVRRLAAGDGAAVGRWRLRVLHPPGPPGGPGEGGAGDGTRNDRSLVVVAEALGRRCLLTGDAEARAERRVAGLLADGGAAGPYDVLKVAHHGSKTSTTPALLAAARPRLALVSAGPGNPYGHPAGEVVRRLVRAGARVLRTDRDGAVHLAWDDAGPLRIELPGSPR